MAVDGTQLLKMLSPAVRPAGVPSVQGGAKAPLEAKGFASLLQEARRGELGSGQRVAVGDGGGAELSAMAQERLARAADSAEAMGARTALVQIDGRAFVLDVPNRTAEPAEWAPGGITVRRVEAVINADQTASEPVVRGDQLLDGLGKSAIGVIHKLQLR